MAAVSRFLAKLVVMLSVGFAATAQQAAISLTPTDHDGSQPVEITSDTLNVSQEDGTAVFEGTAKAVQGEIRLSAAKIEVFYDQDSGEIDRIKATTGVVFTNGIEVAEGNQGIYRVEDGTVTMTGNVLLLQGPNTISGDRLNLDLNTSKGSMTGNVKSVFTPKSDQ